MSAAAAPRRLAELAAHCGAELRAGGSGEAGELRLTGVGTLLGAGPSEVAFYANPSYRPQLATTRAGAVVVSAEDARLPELEGRALLLAAQPYAAFARLAQLFHPAPAVIPGIDPQARVEPGAEVDATARVDAFATVGAGARVEAGAWIGAGAFVGAGARIGQGSRLYPHAVILDGCAVGAGCIVHPGAVVGADGFGFAFDPAGDGNGPVHRKIPQVGIARLEDEVEIGANTCVDRAAFGETVVGRGTKLDNLVQVAHNVRIGPLGVIAAQVGIAGSTTVGTGVAIGGQAGIAGHLKVGDLARVAASAGIAQDVPAGESVGGTPSLPLRKWLRAAAAFSRLPEILHELRQIRQRLDALERRSGAAHDAGREEG